MFKRLAWDFALIINTRLDIHLTIWLRAGPLGFGGASEAPAVSHREQERPSEAPGDTCISQGFRKNLADMWGCPVHESRIRKRRPGSTASDDILHFRKLAQTHSGTALSGSLPEEPFRVSILQQ